MEPTDQFWKYLFIAGVLATIVLVVGGVLLLKFFVFRPAEKRARQDVDSDGDLGPMENVELVSLIRKLDDEASGKVAKYHPTREILKFNSHIRGMSAQVMDKFSGGDLAGAKTQLDCMGRILGDFYDLYLLEQGAGAISQEKVSVDEAFERVLERLRDEYASRENRIHLDSSLRGREFVLDGPKFERIISNTLIFCNYLTEAGSVEVRAYLSEYGDLCIDVQPSPLKESVTIDDDRGILLPIAAKMIKFMGGQLDFNGRQVHLRFSIKSA